METGQMNMIQIPTDATSLATVTGNTKTQSVQDGAEDSSAFAGILRGLTPKAPAQSTVVAGVTMAEIVSQTETAVEVVPLVVVEMKPEILATLITAPTVQLSDKATLKAVRAEHSEKDVEQKQPEDLMPEAAVTNAALAQAAQMLQMTGSMPESAQKVDLQVDTVDTPLKSIQLPNMKADSTNVPEQAVTTSVIAETKPTAVPVPAIMEQAIHAATRLPEFATEKTQGGSVRAPEEQPTQNVPAAALAPEEVTTPEIQAAKAASPELSSIRLQQIMGAYSLPFKAASATPASATPAVTTTDSATPVVAIPALAGPAAATVASATPVAATAVTATAVTAASAVATSAVPIPASATSAALITPAAVTTPVPATSEATTSAATTPASATSASATSAAATPVVAASAATTAALAAPASATPAGERPVEAL
ncbi:MAG: hypothetical protein PHD54_09285, partial [Desulfuromonadaceae bacterium]|nr:hypothetical protein [Desulfuromonadaceae bacterium]